MCEIGFIAIKRHDKSVEDNVLVVQLQEPKNMHV